MCNRWGAIFQVFDEQPAKKLLAWTAAGSKNHQKCTKKGHFLGLARKEATRSKKIVSISLGKLMIFVFEEKLVKKVNEKPYLGSKI